MKINPYQAYQTPLVRETEEVIKFDNSIIAQATARMNDSKHARTREFESLEYHAAMRDKELAGIERTKIIRLKDYDRIYESTRETANMLIKAEIRQGDRLKNEYTEQQRLTELFMRGLNLDTFA